MNRVKIPIRVEWSRASLMKFSSMLFFPLLLIESPLFMLYYLHKFPHYFFYLPLLGIVVCVLFQSFNKDLLLYIKIKMLCIFLSLLLSNIIASFYFIEIGVLYASQLKLYIYFFMGLFYGTFLWDFLVGLSYTNTLYKEYKKQTINSIRKNEEFYVKDLDLYLFSPMKYKPKKSIFLTFATIVFLPLIFLGKTGAYFLGTWVAHQGFWGAASIALLFWIGSLSILMVNRFIFHFMALLKLKYPTQEEVEAYTKEKQA